ncbi:MAG: hypothetical protein HLUCCX14_07630 [Marinobacter excellens HL-55]|uniref:Uncharacterized protein n=1 Tax=Marinobacter excellens HL-55 TaxID=1305731 RepID=A0A0N8KKU8_9GAMM|nr:MAG: hypothetical protein HLUCCX14_07630 [Marinobacter excellens HL-55]
MAIDFYDFGELDSGFAGWRVGGTLRGKRYQKYFSLKNPYASIDDETWQKYQHLRARYYEAKMLARSAACQYRDFINTNHKRTLPMRGLGFQGMTLAILQSPGANFYRCQFIVNNRGKTRRFAITDSLSFDDAWNDAVTAWGDLFGIRPRDVQIIRVTKKPAPSAFKELRRHMNEREGQSIPVDALHHVFAQQRKRLSQSKMFQHAEPPPTKRKPDNELMQQLSSMLAAEIQQSHAPDNKRDPQ